jgi:hypothetical protein
MYVKKRRVAVRVSQFGHDPVDGFFCLALEPDGAKEPETILGLLNSSLRVIPFIVEDDGTVILLTRLNVDWVMAGERVESDLVVPHHTRVVREEPVALHFMNDTTIDGLIQMEEKDGRASDFLNSAADFYPVRTRMGMLLVNKSRVRETRLSTVSPQWARQNAAA